jgi:serine O-acetyltransferase
VSAAEVTHLPSDSPESWDLDRLVSGLRAARHGTAERRDEARRSERPSRDALVEVVRGLRAALFPSHFGVSDFTETSIDFFVGSTLDRSLRGLEEQARRGLAYSAGDELEPRAAASHARELVREFAARLPDVRVALERDLRAALDGDPAATSRAEVLFCYPGVTAITHHRLAHELYRLGSPLLARIVSEDAHSATGIDIHPGAKIGDSFFIDHGTGVVIGETALIGNRVRLYQGVTLGARDFPLDGNGVPVKGAPRHPIVEDQVVIYAGATILGRIIVGRGSVIGGNVWLTRSVPASSHITQARSRRDDVFNDGAGI